MQSSVRLCIHSSQALKFLLPELLLLIMYSSIGSDCSACSEQYSRNTTRLGLMATNRMYSMAIVRLIGSTVCDLLVRPRYTCRSRNRYRYRQRQRYFLGRPEWAMAIGKHAAHRWGGHLLVLSVLLQGAGARLV